LRSACNEGLASFRRQLSDLPLPDLAAIRIAQVLAVVALGGLCGVLVTREELISGELDLLLWWLVSTLTVSAATWVQSVSCAKNRLFNGACHAAQAFVHQLPMLLLILASVGVNGSSRLSEMVRNQGLWPNRWSLFHDPAFTALGFVAMGLVIPSSDGVVTSSGADCPVMSGHSSASAAALLAFVTNRLHVWLQSILLAILLFGGWAVETEPSSLIHRSGIGAVVASLVLITKAWLITALLMGARRLVRGITFRHTTSWTLKYGVPLMLVLGALALSWVWVLNRWSVHWANTTMHWALVSVVIASLLVAAVRARGRNRNGAKAHLEAHWL
jgi:NADH:ubiquinone oxidoreductase subunit H